MTHIEMIQKGALDLGLSLSENTLEQLGRYLELLQKWNKAYNLTAIREADQMVSLHLIDSLSTVPFIKGDKIIDVGTGPGLPGMVLAICLPEKSFTLLDSNGKKTRFLTQVKMDLGLENVTVANERVEKHANQGQYDHVISRAFASLEDMINWCLPLPNENGNFLAMKGVYPEGEMNQLPSGVVVEDVFPLTVPTIDAERHMVVMTRKG
ncbi:16S rRNA (guanine(527)-N(7))-methyltransferase RsmG [Marinomonas mediterranea]|uniref:Ribosomal RNA small subunit methyltransferase G n=1 Tax=Marinomonas mediterranea (strain ATCC 700492 / JCM 21426 / NBRC 103028 / MMB-1) TaxID=717774 RepID=F2K1T8_MARM1|nr:16S rRNA (guanine(527)-N(7))-methyltransferase RsmG [Marinomonas mediterranea]ADZ93422.1 Ribosomal RNA small subunit methyltransferase G [Marinomonas mediterranea MMB-1]WCN15374.1 16S rRNA (guanine(527)-N(7))-methyltransferase RsmG [Marinomonas mediterranea]WCN19414.1 16S rRNA (guanine(527)-N(7))-methyltransferase RsmG [Marinomonas mediterranea MMB-1]